MEVLTAQTFFFVLPPTTSNTHRPTASIWSDGLDASIAVDPGTDTKPYVSLSLSSSVVVAVIATLPPPPPQPCTIELEVHRATCI
jgi:hypothetical protein